MLLKSKTYLFAIGAVLIWQGSSNVGGINSQYPVTDVKDSLTVKKDTTAVDSLKVKKSHQEDFKSKVDFSAKDSMTYSADNKKAYLYGNAKVNYQDIELTADYIEYDFSNNVAFASGMKDSTGNLAGKPVFKQKNDSYKATTLSYNFKTKKGNIAGIITEQDGQFLHAEKTKRLADGTINLKNGKYTTCNAEQPHFYLALTKGKVLPNDKIVSGPAYLVLEDVPLPIGVPFGFFPNKKESTSGIMMPTFGESSARGFYLTNGGYYFALSDYYDATVTGDFYTRGTWGANLSSRYKKRYKFGGNLAIRYYVNKSGIAGIESGSDVLSKSRDFSLTWSHAQEATANPTSRFSASVNYSTQSFDKNQNYTDYTALTTSTKSSSVSYNKSWTDYNLSANLQHSQNSVNKSVSFTLPSITFSGNRFYPFRAKNSTGDTKWYENISLGYSANLDNRLSGYDSTIFTKKTLKTAQYGFKHNIPISANFKFLKYFNISPSLNYTGMFYGTQTRKSLADSINSTTNKKVYYVKSDTVQKLSYAQGFAPSLSVSFSPTLYGMFVFPKKSKIQAIRHVLTPTVGFSYVPDIKFLAPNYYKTYLDTSKKAVKYSIYENNIYGTPTVSTRSAYYSFSLGNNVEMKVKSSKDTVTGTKKIVLIQSLNFSASYNPLAERRKLSDISISGSSPITNGLSLNYNGTFNPYAVDSAGTEYNRYAWQEHQGFGHLTNGGVSFGYTFNFGPKSKSNASNASGNPSQPQKEGAQSSTSPSPEKKEPAKPTEEFSYFSIPMTLSFYYNLNYSKYQNTKTITQSLSFNGSIPLTPKWGFTFSSGYDFKTHDLGLTSCGITRDLHCWVMSINFTPFGTYKYYEFKITALSAFLRDLKYEQRKDYRDYQSYY